jgi:transposase
MRIKTLFNKLIGITKLVVEGLRMDEDGLVFRVRPRAGQTRCGHCGCPAPMYDRRPARLWRHLTVGAMKLWLEYAPRRVHCRGCGVRNEQLPWAAQGSRFTLPTEELIAYLAQVMDKTAVTKVVGIAWMTVGAIVERVVARNLDPERFSGIRNIGIDEFSYRKHHRYLTVVVDHDRKRVIWAGKGRSAETLGSFFQLLAPAQLDAIATVTMDMAGGYIKAVQEYLPKAKIIFDRFHVQCLASNAVDEVRREQVRKLKGSDQGRSLKRSRFALLKGLWNLTQADRRKLSDIQRTNKPLYRAYLLKEALVDALNYRQPGRAKTALQKWLAWASRSKLRPFVRLARTIRAHFDGILAYIKNRQTNATVEGINNRLRTVARRAFGFHSPEALMGMLFLCCGGIELAPPVPM